MKKKSMGLFLTALCILLTLSTSLAETRRGVIFLEGMEESIEETLFTSRQGFSFWYAADQFDVYDGELHFQEGAVVDALYPDGYGYAILNRITEKDAVACIKGLRMDIAAQSAVSRVQKEVSREVENGVVQFRTLIAENGQYLIAEGAYPLDAAEGTGKYLQRVLDSVTFFSAYDLDMLRKLPGEWTYTDSPEEQTAGRAAPAADLAVLTLGEGGWAALDCYDADGKYLSVWGASWSYRPVPDIGGELTLDFYWTDDPAYEEAGKFSLECVYAAYTESWIENDTFVTFLILNPEIRCSGVSPFEALYGDPSPALHKDRGPNMRVVKCKEFVSLRESRSSSAKRLAKVPLGEPVLAFPEYGEEKGFIYCVYHGEEGYILSEYLQPIVQPDE